MASFKFGMTLLNLAARLGLKPADLTKVDDITFIGTGNKGLLTNTKLTPNVINSNKVFKSNLDLTDDTFMNLRSSVSLFNKGKLNPIEERILMDNISDLVRFKETGSVLKKGGIITTETFRDLYRKGAPGSAFKELGKRLARQKKNRFPGNVTPEVKQALKEIDNKIVASGEYTMKDFAKLSEIEKNRIRRIFDPELEAKFPFLKFAEGGRVNFESGTNSDYQKFEEFMKKRGQAMKEFELQQLLEEFNEYLKSSQGPEVIEAAEGGMIKDKGLANILAV